MPPLPLNGESYPPSSSNYQPLPRTDDEYDDEPLFPSSHSSTSRLIVKQRRFNFSPYNSAANDPNDLLRSFLSDTRSRAGDRLRTKDLSLRIRIRSNTDLADRTLELPLPQLTEQDSLPFALADDVPCLRGLQSDGPQTWRGRLSGLVNQLTGRVDSSTQLGLPSRHSDGGEHLQVWNKTQSKPLYATSEEVQRYRQRLKSGLVPPWTPLSTELTAPAAPFTPSAVSTPVPATENAEAGEDEEGDPFGMADFFSGKGDVDLGIFFQKTRKRTTSRLVSIGLQESIERFADDRHFSKHLVCREVVWGWDLDLLRKSIGRLAAEAPSDSKGKGKAAQHGEAEGVEVELEIVGLGDWPIYHVIWSPIAFLTTSMPLMVQSRAALVSIAIIGTLFAASILLGVLGVLGILLGVMGLGGWGGMMWLVRTRNSCVHDTIGTAWSLAPGWMKLVDADPSWDRDRVLDSLKSQQGSEQGMGVERRDGEGWFLRRGVDQDEWLGLHRERILHSLRHSSQ